MKQEKKRPVLWRLILRPTVLVKFLASPKCLLSFVECMVMYDTLFFRGGGLFEGFGLGGFRFLRLPAVSG